MITDLDVLGEILERHHRYGWTDHLTGEWGDVQGRLRASYRQRLDSGDVEELRPFFSSLFRTGAIQGLVSYDLGLVSEEGPEVLGEHVRKNLRIWALSLPDIGSDERVISEQLAYVVAPDVGEPISWIVHSNNGTSVPIMFDTLRHDWYARRCINLVEQSGTILEIGGGYGGLAWQLVRRGHDGTIVLCDIPETLYVAYYFLSMLGIDVQWYDDRDDATVVLVPAREYDRWHDADLVFASHSLCEMGETVATQYLRWIERDLQPRWIYQDTVRVFHPDTPEVLIDKLRPAPPYRELFSAPVEWGKSTDRYCEYLFMRES